MVNGTFRITHDKLNASCGTNNHSERFTDLASLIQHLKFTYEFESVSGIFLTY